MDVGVLEKFSITLKEPYHDLNEKLLQEAQNITKTSGHKQM